MKKLELFRKLIHVGTSILILLIFWYYYKLLLSVLIGSTCITIIVITIMKVTNRNIIGSAHRPSDRWRGIGGGTYIFGLLITFLIYNYFHAEDYIFITALITLGIGDTLASMIGRSLGPIGRIRSLGKSWFATLCSIGTCFVIVLLLLEPWNNDVNSINILSLISFGLIIELLLGKNEFAHTWCLDNLLIPLSVMVLGILIS